MVSIGVTGHRVLAEEEKLEAGLDAVALRIAEAFPAEEWTVLSALAEGDACGAPRLDRALLAGVLIAASP